MAMTREICQTSAVNAVLFHMLFARIGAAARRWFGESLPGTSDIEGFLVTFAEASRKVGRAPLAVEEDERAELFALGASWPIGETWSVDDLARALLLLRAASRQSGPELVALVEEAYRRSDSRERQAVLHALPLLPGPERFAALAIDTCRTHVQPVFEAIACENPYPAAYFPSPNFNQLVLKAFFLGIAVDRIVGLGERRTPELSRMAADYASERRAAGRAVPPDLDRVLLHDAVAAMGDAS